VIEAVPTPADVAPDDNTLRASFSVPEASRWPWYAGAAVAAVAAAVVVRSRVKPRTAAVPTVKGVPGATSARVALPPGTTPHGLGLRWTADRGTARVTMPGPQPGRALSETLR
jgi:hypothetical protein